MFVAINGWRVHYEAKGHDPPILLLHGIPTSSFIWRKQIDALSRHYRVYAPDLLGWGLSDKPSNFDYRIDSYAELINDFLSELGVENVVLGVHDLGGAIGLTFLARHPEKVSRLIILDTFAYLPSSKKLPWRVLYGFLYKLPLVGNSFNRLIWNMTTKRTDTFVTLAFHDKKLVTEDLVQKYRELNKETRLTDLNVLMANGIDGITSAVEENSLKVKVPTLILWAEQDMLFPPSAAEKLHKNIAGSILRTIPDCGHFLQEEKPDQVNQYILDFLRRLP